VAEAAQVVGILLIFVLMVGPPAAALRFTARLGTAFALSILIAVGVTWVGITLAYVTDWPTSFWITALSTLTYAVSLAARRPRRRRRSSDAGVTTGHAVSRPTAAAAAAPMRAPRS
jgi:zinc/manganese transport system permease protein